MKLANSIDISAIQFVEPRHPGEKVLVTSNTVADLFDIRHDSVLRDIRNLQCSREFRLHNFAESSYVNRQGKEQPAVKMTRDGFLFLATGYNSKKAALFKEALIARFNALESYYLSREGRTLAALNKLNSLTVHCLIEAGYSRREVRRKLRPTLQEQDRDTLDELRAVFGEAE